MSSLEIVANALLAALAFVMLGLGLSLTWADFRRVIAYPRAVVVALVVQIVVLPALCFGLVLLFQLPPVFAVGMILLAASPGGISANMFSHLFGGNVAMNITLTAVNTVLAIVSIPLIVNLAIFLFVNDGQVVPMQFSKVVEVILIVLIPVLLGMLLGSWKPALRKRMERPVKICSMVVLAIVVIASVASEWDAVVENFATLGIPVIVFNVAALALAYGLSRAARLERDDAIAISFEVGIHNSTLAIFVAVSVLGDFALALPTAVYSVIMYITAPLFGFLLLRLNRRADLAKVAKRMAV